MTTISFVSLPFFDRIGGVMVSVLTSSVVDREFGHRSGQTNDYELDICYFTAKHTALRKKCKYWLARLRILCSSTPTYLSVYCCFSGLALIKSK